MIWLQFLATALVIVIAGMHLARYGDVLEVKIGLAGIGRTSFTYDYEILDASGAMVAYRRAAVSPCCARGGAS